MSVRCPHCQHVMELKGAKPGRFTPKCTACHQRFVLIIPADVNAGPVATPLPPGSQGSVAGVSAAPSAADAVAAAMWANASPTHPPQTVAPPAQSTRTISDTMPPPPASRSTQTLPPGAGAPEVGLAGPPGDLPPVPSRAEGPRTRVMETLPPAGPELSGSLGGYELLQKLGEGGMGAVYLARQVSLDRQVALKVLSPQLAADPQFVARFTREAYAAAQLSHHNVVQIHDIGFDKDTNFFSMELVPGKTLEKVVHGEGKLDPEVAVGYVLQAARGLRFAHDHGLIHRDVKPDNLLLNDQGIVKVADLGLVKQAGKTEITAKAASGSPPAAAGATQFNISMGTPAYMPPEQARDAAHVDQRADIYSLGCTLYDLLTGRPPFNGQTAIEVITKHQTEPIVPPDRVARHVSPELSAIVMKMMAKRPEDRYQTMAEVVEALEGILGVESGKPFSPKEEHVDALEEAVEQFNGSKWAKLRKNLVLGFYGFCAAGALIVALPQVHVTPLLAGGLIGFALLTTVFYQALIGITRKTHLFTRVRQFIFGARIVDWLKIVGALAVLVLLLVAFNLHWWWLGFAVASAAVAVMFHFSIDRLAERDRNAPIQKVEAMLKTMRLRGLDETALRQFVCKYSGERWEEMYETLFGYEAKRAARRSWGKSERGRDRKKFGAWRDVLIDWLERRMLARKEERERQLLAKIEAKALAAKGLDQASANRKAKSAADRLVDKASAVKASADRRAMMTALPTKTTSGRSVMFADAKPLATWADGFEADETAGKHAHDEERVHESYFKRRFGTPMDFILGPHPRVVLAIALLCLFGLWFKMSGVTVSVDGRQLATVADAVETVKSGNIGQAVQVQSNVKVEQARPWKPSFVPQDIWTIVGSPNGGVAGVLLLLSAFFAGKRLGIAVLAAACFILIGHTLPIPVVNGSPWIASGIGLGLGLLGIMFFRKTAADS